jgi:hypothetical protein
MGRSRGAEDGILVRERFEGAGEVSMASPNTSSHTAFDGSGFYNGVRYHGGRLTSPVYETVARFGTLIPSWQATTLAGTKMELEIRVHSGET